MPKNPHPSACIAEHPSSPIRACAFLSSIVANLRARKPVIARRKKSGRLNARTAITSKAAKTWIAFARGAPPTPITGGTGAAGNARAVPSFVSARSSTELRANLRYKIRLTANFPS